MDQQLTLRLLSPLDGEIVPLDNVPDPVFAQRIAGDGVSVDPTSSVVLAPCAGEIIYAHPAGHAFTLRSAEGAELMIHVGVDTVQLKGEGFSLKVRAGDRVQAGQPLLEFDADLVATKARSLLTQVLAVNMDIVSAVKHPAGRVRAGRDVLLELTLKAATASAKSAGGTVASGELTVANPTGFHARPAAMLAQEAKRFAGTVRLRCGGGVANAKSLVSIMSLNIGFGDKLVLEAEGPGAAEILAALAAVVTRVLDAPGAEAAPAAAPAAPRAARDPRALAGVCASPGIAVGKAFQARQEQVEAAEAKEEPAAARPRLASAIEAAKAELEILLSKLSAEGATEQAAVFGAHRELLEDPELLDLAEGGVAKGAGAVAAWRGAYQEYARNLSRLDNKLLAGRAVDIRDVGARVLRLVAGVSLKQRELPAGCILLADELTPSDIAGLDKAKVAGLCTVGGGASSHVAIFCRAAGLPAIAAAPAAILDIKDGEQLVLDADNGELRLKPEQAELAAAADRQAAGARRREAAVSASGQSARTKDGKHVHVLANVGSAADAKEAARLGAEGVGLCRSEFLFLDRPSAPGEEEQQAAYAAVAGAFPGKEVIIRVLDVGGDKHLPYLQLAKEENPFLGERGIRLLLARPELLRAQLRALLLASRGNPGLKLMFPMVSEVDEFREAKAALNREAQALGIPAPKCGVMIEVPSAALLSAHLAKEADFFSIGTNDLSQYTLAMDRGNPKLAGRAWAGDPSVLKMIDLTVKGARAHNRPVGVCGGAAGDPQLVPLLLGLGVDELSAPPPAVPLIKAAIRELDHGACQALAAQALELGTAAEVRALLAGKVK
ncbi:MAG TPA: phosphoenolpyruvate--protein phosphotransferase [Elusimicrobia bacterium]|nr:MAG: phosphoenolpyruvate--protein phosphotransferase [Elusimicrobia bacterium GWD2_63_28]HCC47190.1 phosphoenolpyruvate--protein phosphotransferase [Elusimicrobiota bacterium]